MGFGSPTSNFQLPKPYSQLPTSESWASEVGLQTTSEVGLQKNPFFPQKPLAAELRKSTIEKLGSSGWEKQIPERWGFSSSALRRPLLAIRIFSGILTDFRRCEFRLMGETWRYCEILPQVRPKFRALRGSYTVFTPFFCFALEGNGSGGRRNSAAGAGLRSRCPKTYSCQEARQFVTVGS